MADVTSSWKQAGSRFSDLGSTIKGHYGKQREEGGSATEEVGDAFRKLGGVISGAVSTTVETVKDPAVKDEVVEIGRSIGSAVTVTVASATDEVKQAWDKRRGASAAEQTVPSTATVSEPGAPAAEAGPEAPAEPPADAPQDSPA